MPRPRLNNEEPRNGSAAMPSPSLSRSDSDALDPLAEAEALRSLPHEAQLRLNRLLSALKQQRRQRRSLRTAMDSLRNLRLDRWWIFLPRSLIWRCFMTWNCTPPTLGRAYLLDLMRSASALVGRDITP